MPNDPGVRPKPPRPRRRLRDLLVILLALLLSPVAAWVAWTQIEAARLDRALDALEARHEPLDIAEFDVKPTTSEQREASHVYAEAMKLVGDATTSDVVTVRKTIEDLCAVPPAEGTRTEQIAALQSIEDRYKPALELFDRASRLDAAGWDDADRPKRFSMEEMRPRNLGLVNAVRIARLACTGHADPAAAALFSTLRLRRVLTLSYYLSRSSVTTAHSLQSVLTFTSPNPALLQEIQQEYEAAADEHALEKHLLYSRAFWLSVTMPGLFSEPPAGYEARRITPLEGIATRLTRALRDHRTLTELREFDEAAAAARQPWPARLDAVAALTAKYPSVRSGSMRPRLLDALTRPFGSHVSTASLSTVVAGVAETLARTRASVGTVAVARYRQAHHGALPASLGELIPEYLSSPLIDPYTDRELQYRRGDGSKYKVYSVGFNRRDDGGVWEQHSDLQSSRRGDPPDIGISVGPWPAAGRD
jgi:hypothetical protein